MFGIDLDNINKLIKGNDYYYNDLKKDIKKICEEIYELKEFYSGNSISFVFEEFDRQISNFGKIDELILSYTEVLNSVKDAYVNQDANISNTIKMTNSKY